MGRIDKCLVRGCVAATAITIIGPCGIVLPTINAPSSSSSPPPSSTAGKDPLPLDAKHLVYPSDHFGLDCSLDMTTSFGAK